MMPFLVPFLPSIGNIDFGDIENYILGLLSGFFRTHRPDESDLPEGTHWLGGSHENGVVRMYFHQGVTQYPWTGEIIATIADDFPVANWSYHHQQLLPLLGITSDGACYFVTPEDWDRRTPDLEWMEYADKAYTAMHDGYAAIGNNVAREETGRTRDITEMRGMPWEAMIEQMKYYAAAASAHGVLGGLPLSRKLISPAWYGLQRARWF